MTAHVDNVPCICGNPDCTIPFGYCHCGCGEETNITQQNNISQGLVKGTPYRYRKGHGRFKESLYLPVNLCICREPSCDIPYGLCHCGCGESTQIAKKTDKSNGTIRNMPKRYIEDHHLSRSRTDFSGAQPFKINGVYCKLIQLTKGLYAIVWASDYDWLSQWVWCAAYCKCTDTYYAERGDRQGKRGKQERIKMHRLIMGLQGGDSLEVDHINTSATLDNRRDNLRLATRGEQQHNRRKQRNNTSGYKGVSYHKLMNKYRATIAHNYKVEQLGYRDTAEAAWRELYVPAALKHHAEFACLN